MKENLKVVGYSKEDEYFHQKNLERIAKLRERAAAERAKQESESQQKEYWMRCPKCGSTLKEECYDSSVFIDRCTSAECGGIYLDRGELEILLQGNPSLLQRLFG